MVTDDDFLRAEVPILVSAAAMLTGMFRITFSLVVIMMETTSSIQIFAPMMFGCIIASNIADIISPSFYDKVINMKSIQRLSETPAEEVKNIAARDFMCGGNIVTVPSVCQVKMLDSVLRGTSHHGFPVVNLANNVIGMIHKKMIVNLLILKAFYGREDHDSE